jgi:HemY protein
MSARETASLRLTAYRQLLVPIEGDARAIRELWKSLRSDERKLAELAAPTVAALARAAAPEDARKIALGVLDAGYDEAMVEAYGTISALAPRQRLEQLERWRARHGDKPKLLEMLGRICASEKLWGKAEAYLLGSLTAGDTVSARVALAQLYESIERPKDSALQFQAAARLALGERPALPGPAAGPAPPGATGSIAGLGAGGAEVRLGGSSGPTRLGGSSNAAVPDGDVGTVPALARPDRQDWQDRVPARNAAAASPGSAAGAGIGGGTAMRAVPQHRCPHRGQHA